MIFMIVILDADTFIYGEVTPDLFDKFGPVQLHKTTLPEQVQERIGEAEIVISNKVPLNADTAPNTKNLKLIVVAATGYNNIDLDWAKQNGILVCNSRDYSTQSVAEHTLAFLFALSHKIKEHMSFVDDLKWSASPHFSCHEFSYHNLSSKKLGILGYGQIGQKVAELAKGLGMDVLVSQIPGRTYKKSDPHQKFEAVLKQVDFLSLHCPLSDLTHEIINEESLKLLKPEASLINMARGPLVNEEAVAKALKHQELAYYASDVMSEEPPKMLSPLFKKSLKNRVLITPHVAWASVESRQNMMVEMLKNIEGYLKNQPRNVVNS